MNADPAGLTERFRGTLAELLGIRFVETSLDRVVAELPVRDALQTVGGAVHGGTLMALADTVGAAATVLNLPPGATTHDPRVEDQLHRGGPRRHGAGEATCLHRGRRTMVWQTRVTEPSGRLLS